MEQWLKWAVELQSMAQAGLAYTDNVYDIERYERLREISAEIIALQDRNRHNQPVYAYGICKVFVLCRVLGGAFASNLETTETRYFALEELPDNLAQEKTTKEQIAMCFQAFHDENWLPLALTPLKN